MPLDETLRDDVWTIVALIKGGECLALDFLESQSEGGDRRRAFLLLDRMSQLGPTALKEKSRDLKVRDGILELRPTSQIRLFYFYHPDRQRLIVLTHAVRKKKDKLDPEDIRRAAALKAGYLAAWRDNRESF